MTGRGPLLALALMLVAFNLRPALSSVGPLLTTIRDATGLSAAGAAALTTLPVFCLGLACVGAGWITRRLGTDRGVLAGVAVIAAGLALRGLDALPALFAGTALAAFGIGLTNVLLPSLVKRDFPARAGLMTGLYTMSLCLGAAAGAALAVPVDRVLGQGWSASLAVWALPAGLALAVWVPFARPAAARAPSPVPGLLRDPLAWQVTAFMGLQSSLAYLLFGWLPALLQERGLSPLEAGLVASLATLHQAPGSLVSATFAGRGRDQRGWVVAVVLLALLPFLTLAFGPAILRLPAAALLGLGVGGCFGLALTLIVLRTPDAPTAAGLSAMAQGVGYALSSLGPLGFGLAHHATGGWGLPAMLYAALALGALVAGLGAARDRQVGRGVGTPYSTVLQPAKPSSGS